MVAWCRDEPDRVGELAWLPDGDVPCWLGRQAMDGVDRLSFVRQRPSGELATGALASPHVSRRLLKLVRGRAGWLVERGRAYELRVDGLTRDRAHLHPGAVIEADRDIVLLFEERGSLPEAEEHPFGQPDRAGLVGESAAAWRLRAACAAITGNVLVHVRPGGPSEAVVRLVAGRKRSVSVDAAAFGPMEIGWRLLGSTQPGEARTGAADRAVDGVLVVRHVDQLPDHLTGGLVRAARRSRLIGLTSRPEALSPAMLALFAERVIVPGMAERLADRVHLARAAVQSYARRFPELVSEPPRLHPELVRELLLAKLPGDEEELEARVWEALAAWGGQRYLKPLATAAR